MSNALREAALHGVVIYNAIRERALVAARAAGLETNPYLDLPPFAVRRK